MSSVYLTHTQLVERVDGGASHDIVAYKAIPSLAKDVDERTIRFVHKSQTFKSLYKYGR